MKMMRLSLRTIFFIIVLIISPALLYAEESIDAKESIGIVKKLEGQGTILHAGKAIPAAVGSRIYKNDTVETTANGSIGIIFRDDTLLSVGPNSKITIDDFVFNPNDKQYAFAAKMTKGTAACVSGTIAKLSPKSVKFETPMATLGLRGTRFVVKVDE